MVARSCENLQKFVDFISKALKIIIDINAEVFLKNITLSNAYSGDQD